MTERTKGKVGQFRDAIIERLVTMGYKRTGFRSAIRRHFAKWAEEEWEAYKNSEDYEKPEDGEADGPIVEDPVVYPTPTAWKEYTENDSRGREWIVFECVEPLTSTLSEDKATRYGELWFDLDSRDELIMLRVRAMDEHGRFYGMNAPLMHYKDGNRIQPMTEMLGHVTDDNDMFPNKPKDTW